MKKEILTLSCCLFFALGVMAQNANPSNIKLGVQASPTFTWMNTNDNQINGGGARVGLNLGLTGQYFFSENYSFSTGISLLLNQGGNLNYSYSGNFLPKTAAESNNPIALDSIAAGSAIGFGVQYIEIPFSIRMRTGEFGYMRYFAELPMFTLAFRTQGRASIDGINLADRSSINIENENISKDITPINIRWGLGGGVEYSVSPNLSLVGGLYYNSTLVDVVRDGKIYDGSNEIDEDSKATIQSITLRVMAVF